MQQLNYPGGGGVQVIVLPQSGQNDQQINHTTNMKPLLTRQLIGLGIAQIIIGVLSIALQSVSLKICVDVCPSPIGHGFWCGLIFLFAGILGILGGIRKKKCQLIAFNILSIVSAAFSVVLIIITVTVAVIFNSISRYEYSPYRTRREDIEVFVSMQATMACLGFLEGIIGIWSSVVCCIVGACCCRCDNSSSSYPQNAFVTSNQQLFINQLLNNDNRLQSLDTTDRHYQMLVRSNQELQMHNMLSPHAPHQQKQQFSEPRHQMPFNYVHSQQQYTTGGFTGPLDYVNAAECRRQSTQSSLYEEIL